MLTIDYKNHSLFCCFIFVSNQFMVSFYFFCMFVAILALLIDLSSSSVSAVLYFSSRPTYIIFVSLNLPSSHFFFFVKQNFIYLDKFSPLSMKTNVKRLNALKKIFFLPLFRVLFLCVFSAFFSILLIMSITFSVCLTTKAIFNISNTCHLTKWMVQFV